MAALRQPERLCRHGPGRLPFAGIRLGVGVDTLVEATTLRFDDFLLEVRARALFRLNAQDRPTPVPLGSRLSIYFVC